LREPIVGFPDAVSDLPKIPPPVNGASVRIHDHDAFVLPRLCSDLLAFSARIPSDNLGLILVVELPPRGIGLDSGHFAPSPVAHVR
jgi:hypothetical protein